MDMLVTSSSSPLVALQENLRVIEEKNPWLHVQTIQEVDCPNFFPPHHGCKGYVQILLTGAASHRYHLADSTDCNHLHFLDDSLVIRIELLFLERKQNMNLNQFRILCITDASSPPLSHVNCDGKLDENCELRSQMVTLYKERETQLREISDFLQQMNLLRQSLQRTLPFLVTHACLLRYQIPVELRALIVNDIRNIVFNDSSIRHAVRLWITHRDIALSQLGHISTWNTSQVTCMKELFLDKGDFNDDITGWDVSNVTNMMGMFANATSFNQPIDCWQINQVRNMRYMFRGAKGFNQTLPSWKKHVEMYYVEKEPMFDYGTSWDILGRRGPNDYWPQYIVLYEPDETMFEVRFLSIIGRNHYLPFRRCDSMASVKLRLAEVVDIPANQIRLLLFGKEIDDYVTIDEARINKDSRVDWVVTQRRNLFDGFVVNVEDRLVHLFI